MFNYKLTKDFALAEFFRTNQGLLYECEQVANLCVILRNIILHASDGTELLPMASNLIKLADFLQEFRNEFYQPIVITSGLRSNALNLLVDGAEKSKHLVGLAADIWFNAYQTYKNPPKWGTSPKVIAMCDYLKKAYSAGLLSELIFHDTYIHLAL